MSGQRRPVSRGPGGDGWRLAGVVGRRSGWWGGQGTRGADGGWETGPGGRAGGGSPEDLEGLVREDQMR